MKLNTNTTKVETSGIAETTNFSIKVTGKAFKILLDGLYSNKPKAVIRETCTNAYDAHLAVGAGDKPFQVQLPTLWNPVFRVRDFGVSMSHEQIMRLFTTVFDSTKDNENNQVGAFGLGSKSPFSLTDNYQISGWKDGKKRTYSAYFGPDGIPALSLLATEESSEPTGVEVKLTIAQKDVDAFEKEAREVLRWFPTTPEFVGEKKLRIEKPKTLVEGNGWTLIQSQIAPNPYSYGYNQSANKSNSFARQGCVVYPIDIASIHNLTKEQHGLLQASIVIDFPIGSLDVAASREALAYEEETINNIIARLNTVMDEMKETYGKTISEAKTRWEAARKRRDFRNTSGLPQSLVDVICKTKWNNEEPNEVIELRDIIPDLRKNHNLTFDVYAWDAWRVRRNSVSTPLDVQAEAEAMNTRIELGNDAWAKIFFSVKGETPTYEGKRIRTAISAGSPRVSILFVLEKETDKQTVLDALGNPPEHTMTKDLPAPPQAAPSAPRKTTGKTKKEQIKVKEISMDPSLKKVTEGPEKVIDLDGDAYYVLTRGSDVLNLNTTGQNTQRHNFFTALEAAIELKWFKFDKPLYGISTTYQKRVEAFGKWHTVTATIKANEKLADPAVMLLKEAEARESINILGSSLWVTILRNDAVKKYVEKAKDSPLGEIQVLLDKYGIENTKSKYPTYRNVDPLNQLIYRCKLFGVDHYTISRKAERDLAASAKIKEIQTALNTCTLAYPLLRGWDHYKVSQAPHTEWAAILQYIKALYVLQLENAKATQQAAIQTAIAA